MSHKRNNTYGNNENINIKNEIVIFIFLMIFFLSYFIDGIQMTVVWYVCTLLCLIPLIEDSRILTLPVYLLYIMAIVLVTGLLNLVVIGNGTISKILYSVVSVTLGYVLLVYASKRLLRIVFGLYSIIIIITIFRNGIAGNVFRSVSNNYVSILLLFSAVLYYLKSDLLHTEIEFIPAIVLVVLSLIAGGRTGVVASTVLLIGVFISNIHKFSIVTKAAIIIFVVILLIFAFSSEMLPQAYQNIPGIKKFMDRGLDGGGRQRCWEEYINRSFSNPRYFICGTDVNTLSWWKKFNGNFHNSYIFIHAYNGIVMLMVMLGLFIHGLIYGIRNNDWIYCFCVLSFCIRSFTDYVFWGTGSTVFAFSIVLYPWIKQNRMMIYESHRDNKSIIKNKLTMH